MLRFPSFSVSSCWYHQILDGLVCLLWFQLCASDHLLRLLSLHPFPSSVHLAAAAPALPLFLVPEPQRWKQRRGLWMKRSSTTEQLHQWTEGVVVWSSASAVNIPQRRCRGKEKKEKVKICARIPHLPDVSEGGRHNSCWWRRKKDRKNSLKENLSTRGR